MTQQHLGDIDFDDESENLEETANWFNPSEGTHKVTFLDNGVMEEREYDDGEVTKVGVFEVEVEGEEQRWSVNKATTPSSLWGQLMTYGQQNDGLEGEEITLIRKGTGTDTSYIVQEAVE